MRQQGLAGAVVAQKAEDLPLMHFKAQVIDRCGFFGKPIVKARELLTVPNIYVRDRK